MSRHWQRWFLRICSTRIWQPVVSPLCIARSSSQNVILHWRFWNQTQNDSPMKKASKVKRTMLLCEAKFFLTMTANCVSTVHWRIEQPRLSCNRVINHSLEIYGTTPKGQDHECERGETSHGNAWDKRFPWSHTGFPSSILPLLHLTNLSPQHPEFLLLWHPFLGSFITLESHPTSDKWISLEAARMRIYLTHRSWSIRFGGIPDMLGNGNSSDSLWVVKLLYRLSSFHLCTTRLHSVWSFDKEF